MAGEWPHPPAIPEQGRPLPQPAFLLRAGGLGGLAAVTAAGAWLLLRASFWFAPLALPLLGGSLLAAWGAAVQAVGGEKVDDHPWV